MGHDAMKKIVSSVSSFLFLFTSQISPFKEQIEKNI